MKIPGNKKLLEMMKPLMDTLIESAAEFGEALKELQEVHGRWTETAPTTPENAELSSAIARVIRAAPGIDDE